MHTYIVAEALEIAVRICVKARRLTIFSNEDAVVLVVSEQRAIPGVTGTPLEQKCVGIILAFGQTTTPGSFQVVIVQVPIGKSVVSLHSILAKYHPRYTIFGDIALLSSGIKIEDRIIHGFSVARSWQHEQSV